jgi:outer membrane protein assembly factor BamB
LASVAHAGADPWSTVRHDNQRTARSYTVASQADALLYEPRSAGSGSVPSAAAQGPDGTVYFSNGGQLRAVDPSTGAALWTVAAAGGRGISAPVVGADGAIYVSQSGANLPALVTALNEDGTERWAYSTAPEIAAYVSDLAVDGAGRVFGRYLETQFTQWHAFALDGLGGFLWKTTVPYASEFDPTPPALLPGGDLVLSGVDADWNDRLMRLDADTGTIEWSVVPGGSLSGPVVADNGLVLVHASGVPPANGVGAFDPDTGSLVWRVSYFYTEYGEDNPPVLLPGGDIVAVANGDAQGNRLIYRISPEGALLDTVAYPSTGYYTKKIVGGDGTVYVWTSMRLMAFSPLSGTVTFEYWPAPSSSCLRNALPAILSDGSIFASWQRKQTCNSPSSFGEYVTLAPPEGTSSVGAPASPRSAAWLRGVTPNPAPGAVTVRFELPRPATMSLRVFDARGALVRVLGSGDLAAGLHSHAWDGLDDRGVRCAAGTYLVSLSSGAVREHGKVTLLDAANR